MPEDIVLPDGFQCMVLPDSDVWIGGLTGGTLFRIPHGMGEITPDGSGRPYEFVADLHYPHDQRGPDGVTGVYIYAHTIEELRERAAEKVEEWRALHKP